MKVGERWVIMTLLLRNTGFHGGGREYGEEGVFAQKNLLREVKQNENKRWRLALTAVFLGQLLGVCGPHVGSDWHHRALCLLLSGLRLSTGAKSESALILWTPLAPPWDSLRSCFTQLCTTWLFQWQNLNPRIYTEP